jgi:hypothetical protein
MSETFTFEDTLLILKHGPYGFFAKDQKGYDNWYKPGKAVNKTDFQPGMYYNVKITKSGKSRFVNEFKRLSQPESQPESEKEVQISDNATPPPLPHEIVKDEPKKSYGGRDFVKEAKGKTYSLIVAGLASHLKDPVEILAVADTLLKGIDDREYF